MEKSSWHFRDVNQPGLVDRFCFPVKDNDMTSMIETTWFASWQPKGKKKWMKDAMCVLGDRRCVCVCVETKQVV